MAADEPGKKSQQRRKTGGTRKPTPATKTTPMPGSDEPGASTRGSSGTSPLDLEPDHFEPPKGSTPADDDIQDDYTAAPAELIEWTPERAGTIVRATGYLLHTADGLTREPGGEELWRATEADVAAIGPPLSRILNRYEPARRLAGLSDEGELMIGMAGYFRKNLATRGRLVTAKRQAEAELEAQQPGAWQPEHGEPPAQ